MPTNTKASTGIIKTCTRCTQPASTTVVFGSHKYKNSEGVSYNKEKSICKSCESVLAKEYREKNPDRILKIKEKYRDNNHGIKWHVQEKISTWRKASNVESDLTVDYLVNLYYQQNGLCYYSGDNMVIGWVDGKVNNKTLSLDRLDPDKGYVKGNVVWCTYLVNTMKQNLSQNGFAELIYKLFHKGSNMPNFTSKEQLQQIAAHARVGTLASIVEKMCVSAAQQGLNTETIDFHESKTANHIFSEAVGPFHRKQYSKALDGDLDWNLFVDGIVDDLVTVTGYNIVASREPSRIPSLVLFLTVAW